MHRINNGLVKGFASLNMCLQFHLCFAACASSTSTHTCEQMPKLDIFTATLGQAVCLDLCPGCSLIALLLGEDASSYVAQQQQSSNLQNPRAQLQHNLKC